MIVDEEANQALIIKDKIINELKETVFILGATSDLLCIVGSYGDTLSNREVYIELKDWNSCYRNKKDKNKFSPIYEREGITND